MGDFSHRPRLSAVPSDGFIRVLKDKQQAVQEYMPLSLLTAEPATGGLRPVYLTAALQALSGAGAVNITSSLTLFTSTGAAEALTLADGTIEGQVKTVTHVVDGGSGVLTPANFADGTTITFTGVAESWTGIWTGAAWKTIGLSGGAAVPAIA